MSRYDIITVDSFSQIFRCFYAMKNLRNKAGEPSGAIFGMTKLLLKLHDSYPSKYGIMAYDSGKVQFRLELAPDYKANRPPMPQELAFQMPYLEELISAFGWRIVRCQNMEADDIIGAIAEGFADNKVAILSSDKDLSQLVNEQVEMLIPASGGFEVRDRAEVIKKFDVPPELIVDYLSLLGDASDNVPGVSGIGPKGAAKLLNEYGSLDEILADISKVSNEKLAAKLSENRDLIKKNQQLIKLRTILPPELNSLESLLRMPPDWSKVMEILNRFELKSLTETIKKIAGDNITEAEDNPNQPDLFSNLSREKNTKKSTSTTTEEQKPIQGVLF